MGEVGFTVTVTISCDERDGEDYGPCTQTVCLESQRNGRYRTSEPNGVLIPSTLANGLILEIFKGIPADQGDVQRRMEIAMVTAMGCVKDCHEKILAAIHVPQGIGCSAASAEA